MSGAGMAAGGFAGGDAARRAARGLLGALGGDTVVLRMPLPPVGDSDAEELGLGSPGFNDVTLWPALIRVAPTGKTLVLVAATAVEAGLGLSGGLSGGLDGAEAVEQSLRSASFVQVGDALLQLDRVERRAVFGRAYLYRLLLKKPEAR